MALTKVITGVTDLNQNNSTNGLKFPTGSVFAGTPEEGMIRNDQSQSSETSSSTMQFYNGTVWKNFVNKTPIPLGSDNFNTVAYAGNGGTQAITTGFTPDLVWTKQRSSPSRDHLLNDSVRGANKILYPNLSNSEDTAGGVGSAYFNSFDSNGFTVGSSNYYNGSSLDYVAWSWKAGGTAVSNTDGTITSQVSANVDAGFSIATFTTPTTNNFSIGHGLSSEPELVFLKSTSGGSSWTTYTQPTGATKYLFLNSTATATTSTLPFNDTAPTDSVINLGSATVWYGTSADWVAYAFHSVAGYSKIGSYTGTGASGNTIVTGFEPAFVMIKSTGVESWYMMDNKRLNGVYSDQLYANLSNAEGTGQHVDFTSNGFQLDTTDGGVNNGSASYIYMAFAAT